MSDKEQEAIETTEEEDKTSLQGTLLSVFFVGLFIVASWISVYLLFLNRL
ncbi:MAG: cytochrome c oxidase subunit 2A [Bacillota bacterium]|nr:cytochrome c oxidase subunit 2A [Bacillota bacterium]